jgi:hypothetical protein
MKVVVKHIDNLKSSLFPNKVTPVYLIYLLTEDNIAVSCEEVIGEHERGKYLRENFNLTLPVFEVTYEEFKNNVLRNEASYVGN